MGGATGTGKSNLLNAWLVSLCSRHAPDQVRFWLMDLKRVELAPYAGLPHVERVAREPGEATALLDDLIGEMQRRYRQLEQAGLQKLEELPAAGRPPRLVLVVDELAQVALGELGQEHLRRLVRITQLGRAAGIHVILATQRPGVDVCPSPLKANVPARLALSMATMQDSRVILDQNGAEELEPPGQAILVRGVETVRVMTPFLSGEERRQRLVYSRGGVASGAGHADARRGTRAAGGARFAAAEPVADHAGDL